MKNILSTETTELLDICKLFATILEDQGEIGNKVKEAGLFTLQRIETSELSNTAKSNYDLVLEV